MVSDIPTATVAEFSNYEESAFDACEGNTPASDQHEEECTSSSFWELMMTMYLPVAAVWLKKSVFGITMLVRTVILGHLLRLIFGNVSEWMHEKTPLWLNPMVQPMGPHSKPVSKSWPPPALTALALLTVFTLVVHPDGFTWVMLGKVKNAFFSMLQSLSECWQLLITDYGILPSIIASATLAALIFILFVMLRSVSQRRSGRRVSPAPDKKKKKRKGHARHRNNVKSKPAPSTPSRPVDSVSSAEPDSPQKSVGESAPDLTPLTPSSAVTCSKPHDSIATGEPYRRTLEDLPETSVGTIQMCAAPMKATSEKDFRERSRLHSVSTVDTTAMSDDLSCGSTSIRSLPSVGAGSSTLSISNASVEKQSSFATTPAPASNLNDHKLKANSNNSRRNKCVGASTPKTKVNPSKVAEAPSRWDALKPTLTSEQTHPLDRQPATAKHVENQNHNHHSQPTTQRPSNRRGGRGGGAARKGRNGHHPGSTRSPVSNSPTQPSQLLSRSPVSPPTLEHRDVGQFMLPTACSLPPPPPGLNLVLDAIVGAPVQGQRIIPTQQKTTVENMPFLTPGHSSPAHSWGVPSCTPTAQSIVTSGFLNASAQDGNGGWNGNASFESPARYGTSFSFSGSPASSLGYGGAVVKENPFAPDSFNPRHDSEEQIEAELQELGGQMAGSILDF